MKKNIVLFTALIMGFNALAQTSLVYKRQRPPVLDVNNYSQIAVGDIVGSTGAKTEQSLDFTDALTSRLFNANTLEVLDRNALENILGARKSSFETMDDQTKQALNKKLKNALLITGRIQSRPLEQKLIYQDQGIVVNGCNRTYYYQVKGDVAVQLKIWDVKTGRMIYSDAVIKPVDKQTKEGCQVPEKLDLNDITRNAIKDLTEEVAKMLVPFEVSNTLQFSDPGLFKSPFKQLRTAVGYLEAKNIDAGLAILKEYTESKDVKDKNKDEAWFNYGLALVYAGKFTEAKTALQSSAAMNAGNAAVVTTLIKIMDDETEVARKMKTQEEARQKTLLANEASTSQPEPSNGKPAAKPASKTKTKKA